MATNENLIAALEALGGKIKTLENDVFVKNLVINDLEEALAAAEKKIEELEKF